MRWTGLLLLAVGCGPNPVGDWEGVVEFDAVDGSTFVNEMSVEDGGTGEVVLYSLGEDPNSPGDMLILFADFTIDWEVSGGEAIFDLSCAWEGCDYDTTMTCSFDDPGMLCDASPDYYADDSALLQWIAL